MMSDRNDSDYQKEIESLRERYLQFNLGNEVYAIPLLNVKEVIPVPNTTPVPNIPAYYKGIMNLRGQIISILDLRKKLNIKPNEDLEEAVVIVELQGLNIGVIVDSINRVLHLQKEEVGEIPEVSSQINTRFIEGVYKGADALTILLDLDGILNIKEIKNMQAKSA